jgi:anti-anti-sigma factor
MAGTFLIRRKERAADKDICFFELEGSFEAPALQVFKEKVYLALEEGKKNVIFECTKMIFAGSAALGCLMGLMNKVKERGGEIVMVDLTDRVAEVFSLLDLFDVFPVFKSVEEAVSHFK